MKEFNYLVEKKRMVASISPETGKCGSAECKRCPLSSANNGTIYNCEWFEAEHPVEATELVRKWSEKHPRKTLKEVLLEKFPAARLDEEGTPDFCTRMLGIADECHCCCKECWNQEVKEYE